MYNPSVAPFTALVLFVKRVVDIMYSYTLKVLLKSCGDDPSEQFLCLGDSTQ